MTDVQFDRLINAITRLTEKLDEVRVELHEIDTSLVTGNNIMIEMTYEVRDGVRVIRMEGA